MTGAIFMRLEDAAGVQRAADALIAEAKRLGLVVTIEQRPLQPLAFLAVRRAQIDELWGRP